MRLIQIRFKVCYTVKYHNILQTAFTLLQLIRYDGHWLTQVPQSGVSIRWQNSVSSTLEKVLRVGCYYI